MPDLDFALRLSAPESTLAIGGLVLDYTAASVEALTSAYQLAIGG